MLGTDASLDRKVFDCPENPLFNVGAEVTDDGKTLLLSVRGSFKAYGMQMTPFVSNTLTLPMDSRGIVAAVVPPLIDEWAACVFAFWRLPTIRPLMVVTLSTRCITLT